MKRCHKAGSTGTCAVEQVLILNRVQFETHSASFSRTPRGRRSELESVGLRACLIRTSCYTVVSSSIALSKTFVQVLDPVCRARSPTRSKIILLYTLWLYT